MSLYIAFPATDTSPAEYASDDVVVCDLCHAEWDADEHAGDGYDSMRGKIFCTSSANSDPSCFEIAREAAYREEAAECVKRKIAEAIEELENLDRFYEGCGDDPAHPYEMLEDLQTRVARFGKGEDSGWRNGLMLDSTEVSKLRRLLASVTAQTLAQTAVQQIDFTSLLRRTEQGSAA